MNTDTPTPEQIKTARVNAGLSQTQASDLVYLGAFQRWSEYEQGTRNISTARWELFQIKTGQHPGYQLIKL